MKSTSSLHLRFGLSLLGSLLRGRFVFPGGHRPTVGHQVPDAFAGVGVAAAEDPEVDDWLIARLQETGIRHVRLDFSYGDASRPAARLLDRLLSAGYKVILHLIQPADRARSMASSEAVRGEWQRFVVETLDRFGVRVEIIEIGSTVNRKRWAGYSLAGFVSMWDVAWKEVRARGLTLAGPSVTDFEPPWNVGLLALLCERGQLPDLHTDNLFAERSTEPERFDHKILGRRMAGMLKFNLIKKARLLARVGADYGVPRLISPAAFWTLPRIERQLPHSEEKQADYLTRYMVLCAASGAVERAWWGPLVCHREGLIDNGERPYPALERITHYAGVEGTVTDLRVRPALHALQAFASLVPGACYEGRLNESEGLEVHAFRSRERLVHIVWTINGRAAALDELYSQTDLADAEYRDRDGRVEPPEAASRMLVCESPRYILWPADRRVMMKAGANLMPGCALAVHDRKQLRPYAYRDACWHGIVLAASFEEYQQLVRNLHPKKLAVPDRHGSLRYARNVIWKVADPRTEAGLLVVKKPLRMPAYRRLLDRSKPVKGLRSWSGTCELRRIGVDAAAPVAYFEATDDASRTENFYICEYVPTDVSVREVVAALNRGENCFADVSAQDVLRELAHYVLRMHNGGFFFRDLSSGNIPVKSSGHGGILSSLSDTGRIRMYPQGVPLWQRLSDLARICNKLQKVGRNDFLAAYFSAMGRGMAWFMWLPFALYDVKVWAKRKIGRKVIKRVVRRMKGGA